MLAPIDPADFLANDYERRVRHIARDQRGYFEALLSLEEVDRALTTLHLGPDAVSMVRADVDLVPRTDYMRGGIVDPVAVMRLFAGGATVILPALHAPRPTVDPFGLRGHR